MEKETIEIVRRSFRAGVAISVSNRLSVGHIQLLEQEYEFYILHCEATYKKRWELDDNPVYREMYFVFGECEGQRKPGLHDVRKI